MNWTEVLAAATLLAVVVNAYQSRLPSGTTSVPFARPIDNPAVIKKILAVQEAQATNRYADLRLNQSGTGFFGGL